MLGKPVRGQRTWSNAWTAYNSNKLLRTYINKIYLLLNKNKKIEKIDYQRAIKKQKRSKKKKPNTKIKKHIISWF
jgi:hypothetical protein